MQRSRDPKALSWQWTWLIGSLLAVLGLLAYAGLEAADPTHRHVIDGEIIAHDHLDTGSHEHGREVPTPPGDEEDREPSPHDDQVYLGQVTLSMLDSMRTAVAISAPEVIARGSAIETPKASGAAGPSRPPGRGPPTPAPVVS